MLRNSQRKCLKGGRGSDGQSVGSSHWSSRGQPSGAFVGEGDVVGGVVGQQGVE
ncbi:hypothetical protein ACFXKC_41825 [Streptomyces sp. NPDC059340]|uniref:hypothetical protein n=1 Tax=Streptomyces sp. NPDC059340 TaxID=3346806 RepID=UPI0036A8C69B